MKLWKIKREILRIVNQLFRAKFPIIKSSVFKNAETNKAKKLMTEAEYLSDKAQYVKSLDNRFICEDKDDYPCLQSKYASNSLFGGNYFIQDIWGARKVLANKPLVHYDVGSLVSGFIAHLMVFNQNVIQFDIRPQNSVNTNSDFIRENGGSFNFIQADATNLEQISDCSIESLSALCSVEHFGLGRYGDPIDSLAWEKALKAFQRVLKPGGKLYFSVPIGSVSKICFNAHIVFHPRIIIDVLNEMKLLELSYINNKTDIIYLVKTENNNTIWFDESFSSLSDYPKWGKTGLFEFVKK